MKTSPLHCFSAFALLLACISTAAPAQQPAPSASEPPNPTLVLRPPPKPPQPSSPITPEGRIHLDVVVTDAAGKPIPDLLPTDFKILDNGAPRKLLSFRGYDGIVAKPNPPVEVLLLIDTVNLPFQQISFVRQQVTQFLQQNNGRLAQPVSLMLLTEKGLRVQPRPSTDGNALVSVLSQITGSVHGINAAMGSEGDLERFQLSLRQMATIAENEALRPGRKLLIWVGPGWPMLTNDDRYSFTAKDQQNYFAMIVEMTNKLREARIVVDSVSPAFGNGNSISWDFMYKGFLKGVPSALKANTGNLALKVLAIQSGGRIFGPDNDLVSQINSCIADASAFYTLSFNPPPAEHPDEYHSLQIVVDNPAANVRTTAAYYNQPPSDPAASQ